MTVTLPTIEQQRAAKVYRLLEDALQEVQRIKAQSQEHQNALYKLSNEILSAQMACEKVM